jgi:hypothetical protein
MPAPDWSTDPRVREAKSYLRRIKRRNNQVQNAVAEITRLSSTDPLA